MNDKKINDYFVRIYNKDGACQQLIPSSELSFYIQSGDWFESKSHLKEFLKKEIKKAQKEIDSFKNKKKKEDSING